MVLGEGAAVLALENLDLARERGAPVLAEIIGYGISTDNFHITQPEPSGIGARQAMERALESAHISAADVDYINAHGTATVFQRCNRGQGNQRIVQWCAGELNQKHDGSFPGRRGRHRGRRLFACASTPISSG